MLDNMLRKTLTILSLVGLLLSAGCCLEYNFEGAENYATAVEHWQNQFDELGLDCIQDLPVLITGECVNESAFFVLRADGFSSETQYFDPQTEEFISMTRAVDVVYPVCGTVTYWPFHFDCGEAIVTEVFCGTGVLEGEVIPMP